ncbi:AAA domain-containing protein [Metabacillus endolithicus]|uniref:AAA domain-containing protein n=1 Tax=Metabacillus endolithicus TaxID=1535204 RepID=A0ABW5BU49_9BACI
MIHYIKELSQLKQKPVSSYKNYEDVLWVSKFPNETECLDFFRNNTDEWLYVKKPVYPTKPSVPKELENWLLIDVRTYLFKVNKSVLKELLIDDKYVSKEEFLEDNPEIIDKIDEFKNMIWEPFIQEAKRVDEIQALYDRLFKIYQYLQSNSESMELVVSTGLLQWKLSQKEVVERHVLTSIAELKFNSEKAEFTIIPSFKGKVFEYEEDMLLVEHRLTGAINKEIENLLSELNEELYPEINSILQNIVHSLDSKGTYYDTLEIPISLSDIPTISLSPAFILRKKLQKSFQKACQTAIEELQNQTEPSLIPSNLFNMFETSPTKNVDTTETNMETTFKKAQEFYFPLPSNEEQNRIISTLNRQNSVLVQGPPGTGKTHTIANLTSHLLATGNRVLITSQTAKALSVLKSKLPKELQDLSVSLLGGDSTSMKDLEKVVTTISTNRELFDLKSMERTVSKKEMELKNLKSNLSKTKSDLISIREEETYEHQLSSRYKGTAQKIAEIVYNQENIYDWYRVPVTFDTPSTFWEKEKRNAIEYIRLKSIKLETPDGYEQFEYPKIDWDFLEALTSAMKEEAELIESYELLKKNESNELVYSLLSLDNNERDELKVTLQNYKQLVKPLLFSNYPSLGKVIKDIFTNHGYIWEELVNNLSSYLKIIKENKDKFEEDLVSTENITTQELKKMFEDLHEHVSNGGTLGNFLFRPKIVSQYKSKLQTVKYNSAEIKTVNQIEILHAYAQYKYSKEKIEGLLVPNFISLDSINKQMVYLEFENVLSQIELVLEIHQWRNKLIKDYTFLTIDTFNEEMADSLSQNIEIFDIKQNLKEKSELIDQVREMVRSKITEKSHPLYQELLDTIEQRNSNTFRTLHEQYLHYQEVMQRDSSLKNIFIELNIHSSTLVKTLEETFASPIWSQRFIEWDKAFEWKQAQNWVREFSMKDETTLSIQFDQIEKNIKDTVIEIGSTKAWISMLSNMTETQSKHLKAWVKAVKNVGKGTGKNAARYRADAQMHMENCMEAIPAWIMPLNQVYDNFEIRSNLFDVIIIDEASQSWHDALLLKFMAKKLIIVGDDKQISPTNIGITDQDILKLQTKYFKDIDFPFGRDLNLNTSFFDVAYIMFKDTITLKEHFRCMPEIIGFSNKISYQSKPLIPLRQYPANRLEPVKSIYLPHGVREGSSQYAYNEIEAEEIVKQIKNCIEDPRYADKTFGVISLLGANQAKLIQSMLLKELGAELMEERKIICGDAYAFQGDERDIIFLSMVVAKNGSTRIVSAADDKTRQRFNVAVSRAKDQLWVVHSISINDINNRNCLRYQLLSYIVDPLKEETESNREKCESGFEKSVFDAITAKGYRVIPQYNVANYRIDLVIQGEKSKLAVECDGDHWHTSVEDRERDFLRERVLQRAGWTFWRVLGSTYYNNPENALESLWEKVDEMGIRPYVEWAQNQSDINKTSTISNEEQRFKEETQPENSLENQIVYKRNLYVEENQSVNHDTNFHRQIAKEKIVTDDTSSINPTQQLKIDLQETDNLNLYTNEQYENYKKLLRSEGFEVLQDQPPSGNLYVVGTEHLERELEYIAPRNNSFTFYKDGTSVSNGEPVWGIFFDPLLVASSEEGRLENISLGSQDFPITSNTLTKVITNDKLKLISLSLSSNLSVEEMLKELDHQGIEILDYRKQTETIWVIGDKNLQETLTKFRQHKIVFRYMKNGNATTTNRPAWFAKAKN